VLTSPLGTPIWSTPLTTDRYLVGPLAANPEGGTYFADDGFLVGGSVDGGPSILALTPCGKVAWRVAWGHPANTGTETFLIVSGSRLVAVESDVEAFDLATGAHLWTADLLGFAAVHGQGGLTADQVLVATPAVAADGTVYVLFNAPAVVWLLAIDTTGAVSLLATVPIDGDGGFATDLILDVAGRLDVSTVATNFNPGPGSMLSFARDGTLAWRASLAGVSYENLILSGESFLLSEDNGERFGLDGGLAGSSDAFTKPAAVDHTEAGAAVYAIGGSEIAIRQDTQGRLVWSSVLAPNGFHEFTGGPLVGDGAHVFYLVQLLGSTSDGGDRITTGVYAVAKADGGKQTWEFDASSPGYMLLTAAGELVFSMGSSAVAIASGGERPSGSVWPTPRGGADQRGAAIGQ
jgi:outer membrane protein assembly factor BamB